MLVVNHKLIVDYRVALKEGRFSEEFIEEMREEAFFDIFYECRFPDEEAIDERGYRVLLTMEQVEEAMTGAIPQDVTQARLGIDVGAGGDHNVFVVRTPQVAWVESANRSNDTMTHVTEAGRIMEANGIKPRDVFIDDIGIGRGVTDRLKETGKAVNGVSVGEKPIDKTRYKNLKAQAYWECAQWVRSGGKLVKHDGFRQLPWVKYKVSTDKVLQIEPKEDLKRRSGKSPDYADALMLNFTPQPPEPGVRLL